MTNHNYAVNPLKLNRAINAAAAEGKEGDDARIKELYISYGGKVVEKAAKEAEDGDVEETAAEKKARLVAEKKAAKEAGE